MIEKWAFWLALFLGSISFSVNSEDIPVSGFYGNYDVSMKKGGQQALSLRGPKIETWNTSVQADDPLTIGVLLPSLLDSYWLAVNYGIMLQAKESGIRVKILDARGYTNLKEQQQQLKKIVEEGVDGIVLGSISYNGNDDLIKSVTHQGIPVVALVNDVKASNITAKSMVSYYDMGFFAGEYVAEKVESSTEDIEVIFLPGPYGSGWAADTVFGFTAATEFNLLPQINVVDIRWGDTSASVQKALLQQAIEAHPDADYLVGNAVAAKVAAEMFAQSNKNIKIVSTYITSSIYDHIQSGTIDAAPSDLNVVQARVAVGMVVKAAKGEVSGVDFPFRAGPLIPVVTQENIHKFAFEELFGPRDFKPQFHWKPE